MPTCSGEEEEAEDEEAGEAGGEGRELLHTGQ